MQFNLPLPQFNLPLPLSTHSQMFCGLVRNWKQGKFPLCLARVCDYGITFLFSCGLCRDAASCSHCLLGYSIASWNEIRGTCTCTCICICICREKKRACLCDIAIWTMHMIKSKWRHLLVGNVRYRMCTHIEGGIFIFKNSKHSFMSGLSRDFRHLQRLCHCEIHNERNA